DETAHAIDREIREIIDTNYGRARRILEDHADKLHTMAEALLKYETIDSGQIARIMRGEPAGEPDNWDNNQDSSPPSGPPSAPATPRPDGAPGGVVNPAS
ncbi:MAG: ATP-dependent metalloprotease, partial [Algiphilus sp.]